MMDESCGSERRWPVLDFELSNRPSLWSEAEPDRADQRVVPGLVDSKRPHGSARAPPSTDPGRARSSDPTEHSRMARSSRKIVRLGRSGSSRGSSRGARDPRRERIVLYLGPSLRSGARFPLKVIVNLRCSAGAEDRAECGADQPPAVKETQRWTMDPPFASQDEKVMRKRRQRATKTILLTATARPLDHSGRSRRSRDVRRGYAEASRRDGPRSSRDDARAPAFLPGEHVDGVSPTAITCSTPCTPQRCMASRSCMGRAALWRRRLRDDSRRRSSPSELVTMNVGDAAIKNRVTHPLTALREPSRSCSAKPGTWRITALLLVSASSTSPTRLPVIFGGRGPSELALRSSSKTEASTGPMRSFSLHG